MIAEIVDVGLAGAKCKAEETVKKCGKANLSLSWAWCFAKEQLTSPPAVCLAKTKEGQKKLLAAGVAVATGGGSDMDFGDQLSEAASSVLGSLPSAVIPVAKCLGDKIGYATLAGLTLKAATGGGTSDLLNAVRPHIVSCGASGVASQLGNSPLEQALKSALSELAKATESKPKPKPGEVGYIDPKLQKMIENPKVVALFTGGQLKKAATYQGTVYTAEELAQATEQQSYNSGLILAAVAVGAVLLVR